jgi:predicted GIY-YIG superfamily endonuclease
MTTQWPGLLISAAVIARYCGVSQRTVRRWREHHKLPLCHLPDGRLATSQNLVDRWLEGIIEEESLQPWGARWKRQAYTAKAKRALERRAREGSG